MDKQIGIEAKQIVAYIQNNINNTQHCIDFVEEELNKYKKVINNG